MMVNPMATSTRAANRYRAPAMTDLADLLDQQVRERPDARALVVTADRIPLSYHALAVMADDVAGRLRDTELREGDPVGIVCANNAEFVVGLIGAARAGLVVALLDPALSEGQISARLDALGVRAILTGPAVAGARFHAPTVRLRVDVSPTGAATATLDMTAAAVRRAQRVDRGLTAQDALILFTAGTTDRAKMVPLTHANVTAAVQGICATYKLGPDDATVAVMPFFHGHGLFAVLLATLASGGSVLLPERGRFSAHTFWDDVRVAAATWFTAAPTMYEILLNRSPQEFPRTGIGRLRFVRSCSAPLNMATARAMERTLGAPLLSAYGMTETAHQAASEPLPGRGPLKHGSVGRAAGLDLRVLARNGDAVPTGTEGEVWVHGPTVARGYLGDPAETARSFVDGWFRTGDLGSLDEDGYLFLTGRIKNQINRGGEKIAPEHVEDVLAGCPGVAEAAVFAIPDPTYGQRVGAAVVLGDGEAIGPEQILDYCRDRLPAFEVPDRIDIVPELLHTPKGALDRRAVADRYGHR